MNPNKFGIVNICMVCAMEKAPRGRSIPVPLSDALCTSNCAGYYADPRPGSLWPHESEADFGYPVSDAGTEIHNAKEC